MMKKESREERAEMHLSESAAGSDSDLGYHDYLGSHIPLKAM